MRDHSALMTRVALICFDNDIGWSQLARLANAAEFLAAYGFTLDELITIFDELGRRSAAQGAALAAYREGHGHA